MDSDVNILEEMEMSAVEQGLTPSSQKRRRRKRDEDSPAKEESCWMKELNVTMKANQALLEKLLEEKNQRTTDRDPFIQYISQILRTVPQEQYVALSEGIMELVRGRDRRASTSWTRPGGSGTHPNQQPSLYPQQQQYYQPWNQDHSSSWQHGGYQPLQPLQPVQTPRRTRESVDSVGRILAANIGEEWNNTPATGSLDSPSTDTD